MRVHSPRRMSQSPFAVAIGISVGFHLLLLAVALLVRTPANSPAMKRGEPLFVELPQADQPAERGAPASPSAAPPPAAGGGGAPPPPADDRQPIRAASRRTRWRRGLRGRLGRDRGRADSPRLQRPQVQRLPRPYPSDDQGEVGLSVHQGPRERP